MARNRDMFNLICRSSFVSSILLLLTKIPPTSKQERKRCIFARSHQTIKSASDFTSNELI